MKILLDSCVWGKARHKLAVAGHDVVWAGDWPTDPGDEEILARAHGEGRVLVTLDKDFGELVYQSGRPHRGVLLLRLEEQDRNTKVKITSQILETHGEKLEGHFCVYQKSRLRIRK